MRRIASAVLCVAGCQLLANPPPFYIRRDTWWETMRASRGPLMAHIRARKTNGDAVDQRLVWRGFWDRLAQDFGAARAEGLSRTLKRATVFPTPRPAMELHVAVDGSDRNPGSAAQPFATIGRARDVIRELKQKRRFTRPVRVLVHRGTHYLSRTIRLGPQDSGTRDCPIIYQATEGEKVILSGGKPIRAKWQTDDGNVYYTDIPEARDASFGRTKQGIVVRYDERERVQKVGRWIRGIDWIHDGDEQKGSKRVIFSTGLPKGGRYEVRTKWKSFGNRARQIPVTIEHADGVTEVQIDQTREVDSHLLGTFRFGAAQLATVTFETSGTKGYVAVHQVELIKTSDEDVPEPWKFRQLFVNGKRAILARYPNHDPSDILRKGWLYVRHQKTDDYILAGLGQSGDWMELKLETPKTGRYALWVGVATVFDGPHEALALKIDGRPVPLLPIRKSGGWRTVVYSKAAIVDLAAGRHTMRWESAAPTETDPTREVRVHMDAFILSDAPEFSVTDGGKDAPPAPGETRIIVEAEDDGARVAGESKMTFMKFKISDERQHAPTDWFACEDGIVRDAWLKAPHAEIFMFATWCWFNATTWVDSIEKAGATVVERGRPRQVDVIHIRGKEARTRVWPGNRFYVFNLRAELDQPGEWYLDYPTGRLYYWPREGESVADAEIVAPALNRLFELGAPSEGSDRVEYVAIRGFTFSHTDYTSDHPAWRSSEDCAVLLENCWHCAVEDCTFTNIGGYGIRLCLDSCLNRIAGNTVALAGAGGVILRGPWVGWGQNVLTPGEAASILYPVGNLITSNHVHHCGTFKKYVAGIHAETRPATMAYAPGNVYSHNWIHDLPRNGIFGFRFQGGNVVEYNHIHDVLQESDDGGLVHFCTAALNGTAHSIFRNNLLHDVTAYRWDDEHRGRTGLDAVSNGHGIYLDGNASNTTVENNVISNTRKGCVFIHSGEHNVIRNNILLNDRRHHLWQTKTWTGNRFERNIVCWTTPTPYYASLTAINVEPTDEQKTAFDRNLVWHHGQPIEVEGYGSFNDWQAKGFDQSSALADPLFEKLDLANRVCQLSPRSPAFALGFHAIDLSEVGLRKSATE